MKIQRVIFVTLMSGSVLASHFKVLRQSFLCYGQGAVRRVVLYRYRSFLDSKKIVASSN